MKPIIATLLLCIGLTGFTQTQIEIYNNGDASKLKVPISRVYISYPMGGGEWKRDSVEVNSNGKY